MRYRKGWTASDAGGCLVVTGIIGVIGLAIGMLIIQCIGGLNIEYSDGSRSGVVQKFSKKGVVWKTWEGQLNLGYNTTNENGQLVPEVWLFSCSDDAVAKDIQQCERSGKRVTLNYKQYLVRGFRYGATSYDVVGSDSVKE